jgi:hypothetical protein
MLKTIRPQQSDGLQYTPVSGRYRCKPMYIGSPSRARTYDLRINSPSEKSPESRAPLGFRGFRLGNRLADFALISARSPPIPLFQFPSTLSCDALRKLVKFIVRQSPESGPGIGRCPPSTRHRHIIKTSDRPESTHCRHSGLPKADVRKRTSGRSTPRFRGAIPAQTTPRQ